MLISNIPAEIKSITLNMSPVNINSPLTKRDAPKKRVIWTGRLIEKINDKKTTDASKSIKPNIFTNAIILFLYIWL